MASLGGQGLYASSSYNSTGRQAENSPSRQVYRVTGRQLTDDANEYAGIEVGSKSVGSRWVKPEVAFEFLFEQKAMTSSSRNYLDSFGRN